MATKSAFKQPKRPKADQKGPMSIKPTEYDMHREAVASALERIQAQHDGYLRPADVVAAAEDSRSVLHGYFEWDDTEAGHKYRIAQAGALIRQVRMLIIRSEPEAKDKPVKMRLAPVRVYQSPEGNRTPDKGYQEVGAIMADPEKRQDLLRTVLRELSAIRRRYRDLEELRGIWDAVTETMDSMGYEDTPARQGNAGPGKAAQAEERAGQ